MSVSSEVVNHIAEPVSTTGLHAVVKGRELGNHPWKEVTEILSYSSTGSSFHLSRQCDVGTLISLILPLPVHMRCYDHDKEFYGVWGLVQHCQPTTATEDTSYHIGVAFIGKFAPDSYKDNPLQHYRISGVKADGMWNLAESKTPFKKRSGVRFWQSINLYLALIDTKDGSRGGERTVTENISRNGAAVFSNMNVGIGDRVKFISEKYDFSGLAVVCNVQLCEDGRNRLHLRFIENKFPVTKLMRTRLSLNRG
jgi:hypothetical protein